MNDIHDVTLFDYLLLLVILLEILRSIKFCARGDRPADPHATPLPGSSVLVVAAQINLVLYNKIPANS